MKVSLALRVRKSVPGVLTFAKSDFLGFAKSDFLDLIKFALLDLAKIDALDLVSSDFLEFAKINRFLILSSIIPPPISLPVLPGVS